MSQIHVESLQKLTTFARIQNGNHRRKDHASLFGSANAGGARVGDLSKSGGAGSATTRSRPQAGREGGAWALSEAGGYVGMKCPPGKKILPKDTKMCTRHKRMHQPQTNMCGSVPPGNRATEEGKMPVFFQKK